MSQETRCEGSKKPSVAIIGGGVAGLTAGYFLHDDFDLRLFEKTDRIGGNAYTYRARDGEEVDIAVAAFGRAGYPMFYKLLDDFRIRTKASAGAYMSFHDLDTGTGLYLTPTWKGLKAQRFKAIRPSSVGAYFRLLAGVRRAKAQLDAGSLEGLALRDALKRIPQISGDARIIFLSALCLVSSMSCDEVLEAPASFFINKLKVHNDVISPKFVYSVRTVEKKTKSYVDALAAPYRNRIVLGSRIRKVLRGGEGVTLLFEDGERATFDHLVFACNADQALALLEKPTEEERRLLGVWRYKEGRLVVHRDHASFPKKELIQAYTFLYTDRQGRFETSVNGGLWHEPGVSPSCDLISSQHPNFPIREELVELDTVLRTPIFDFRSVPAIGSLPKLNGANRTYYCGSHFGYGLHEDAVRSAIEAASALRSHRD